MINKYCTLILGTMLGVSTLAFSAGSASAAAMLPLSPVASGDVNALNDGIIQINHRNYGYVMKWNRNRHGIRCRYYDDNCRHRFRGHFYQTPYWTFPLIIGGGFGANSYYNNNYYDNDFDDYGWSNRHVRWCLNRYRSYNPRTNTWVSYSGQVRRCYSPF